jgi:hypothetical protein
MEFKGEFSWRELEEGKVLEITAVGWHGFLYVRGRVQWAEGIAEMTLFNYTPAGGETEKQIMKHKEMFMDLVRARYGSI